MTFDKDDEVEAKRAAGLGGYERARVVDAAESSRSYVLRFARDGATLTVAASRVRASRSPAPRVREAAPTPARQAVPVVARPLEALSAVRAKLQLVTAAELHAVPKPAVPVRSAGYLEHVRAQACCGCSASAPSDPHHYGPRGLGQKTDDLRTVPLCRRCHDGFHDRGFVPDDARHSPNERAATRERFLAAQVASLVAWFSVR